MNNKKVSLHFKAKLTSFEKLNENFLKAKCYVVALGKNRNKSYFSKENVDKAYPSLAYVPVVGHLKSDENGNWYLGGHDYKIDISDGFKLKSQCIPFGVAIPSPEPQYEDIVEEDGTIAQYLVCDVVIWIGRYPELASAMYDTETYFNHSMEILYTDSQPLEEDNTYANITEFSFDALCMLGKSDDERFNIEPCFPSASFKPAEFSNSNDEFKLLISEMKNELSLLFEISKDDQGGTKLDEKLKILNKFGKSVTDLNFSIDNISVEELSVKMEELYGEEKAEPVAFSATYKEKRQALVNALDPIIVKDTNGNYLEETYFYVEDFSDEYVFVEKDYWTVNNYECKYGRYSYTFDEVNLTATLTSDFEEMIKVWMTLEEKAKLDEDRANYEIIKTEFASYKDSHSTENSVVNELTSYKAEKEADTIFEKYEDKIGKTSEFAELKSNIANYSVESLEKECIYILGLHAAEIALADNPKGKETLKFSVEGNEPNDSEPYGGLMRKYLNK